jgi:polysaccharide export outer membrane protein
MGFIPGRIRAVVCHAFAACIASAFIAGAPVHASDYVVGEGDVIKITVYGHDDLATVERVSGSGMIAFPLLGQVKVSGLTVSELSERIAELLSDGYIVSPQVNVFIQEFRSQKAVIMGEVLKPGLYELKGRTGFLELVSMAGGLSPNAGDTAIIKRRTKASAPEEVITVDLAALIERGETTRDVPVLDGDSIYVSRAGRFYVTGEVRRPDEYKFKEGTTVIKAITMAGGLTDKAAPTRIKIIRKMDGKEVVSDDVNMDEPVMPDDVLVVPESFF